MSECRRRERLANEARSSEEKERINRLQGELAEIRRSVSFRLGQLLVAAMQSPGRHAFRLPADLFRLAMDYRRRKGSGVGNDSTVDGPQRRLSGYLRPGIEAHDCLVFPAFEAFTQTRDSELRVACVVSEHLHRCLEPETLLQPLDEAEWDAQLSHFRPNFVLLESAWAFNSKGWVEDFPGGEARSLRALVAECRNRNVPVVFWDTQHNIHRDLFFQVATSCDLVFAMDPLSVERYRQELGDERVALLKLAVQPVLHNPARSHCVGPRQPLVLFDGWADALEWPERFRFLEALAASGLRIVESRYRFVANKLRDLPELETSILGNIEYARLLSARRLSRVC